MQVYWFGFAGVLLVLSHLMWRRGVDTSLLPRMRRVSGRIRGGVLLTLAASTTVWVGAGIWVFYNTNVLNRYEVSDDRESLAADMEKQLLGFESLPQPTIVEVKLQVDLYPKQQRAQTQGSYVLENRSGAALSHFHVQVDPDAKQLALAMDGAQLEKEYPRFGYRIYALDSPMAIGERRTLRF